MGVSITCAVCERRYEVPREYARGTGRCLCGAELALAEGAATGLPAGAETTAAAPAGPESVLVAVLLQAGREARAAGHWLRALAHSSAALAMLLSALAGGLVGAFLVAGCPVPRYSLPGASAYGLWALAAGPVLGLLVLRAVYGRAGLRGESQALGLVGGVAAGVLLRALLQTPPRFLYASAFPPVPLGWACLLSTLTAAAAAPGLALWSHRAARAPDGAPAWLRRLWNAGEQATRQPLLLLAVALCWWLPTALLVRTCAPVPHSALASRAAPTQGLVAGVVFALLMALVGPAVVWAAHRWRLGPYAASVSFVAGLVGTATIGLGLPPPLRLLGVLLLPLLALVGLALGSVLSRDAPGRSAMAEVLWGAGVVAAIVVSSLIALPQARTRAVLACYDDPQGRRLAEDTIRQAHGASGARLLLALLREEQRRQATRPPETAPPGLGAKPDGGLLQSLTLALPKVGRRGIRVLLGYLPSADPQQTALLLRALGQSKDRQAVPHLVALLEAPPRRVTPAPTPIPPPLSVRLPLLQRLLLGRRVTPARPVPRGLSGPPAGYDLDIAPLAAAALGEIGDPAAAQPLLQAALAGSPALGAAAAEALLQLGDPAGLSGLRPLLLGDSGHLRRLAAQAMGRTHCVAALPELLVLLEEADCREAAEALAALGDRRALPFLRRRAQELLSEGQPEASAVVDALQKLGDRTSGLLLAAALAEIRQGGPYRDYSSAAVGLAKSPPEQVQPSLERLLGQPESRQAAIELLQQLHTPWADDLLRARGLPRSWEAY